MTDKKQESNDIKQTEETRKAYTSPTLTAYGNVREFTRGGGGSSADKSQPQVG
jgi:hypothetical protein